MTARRRRRILAPTMLHDCVQATRPNYVRTTRPVAVSGLGATYSTEAKVGAFITLAGVVLMFGLVKGITHWDTVTRKQAARRRARMHGST